MGTALTLKQKYNTYNIFTISLNDKPLTVKPANIAKINTALQFTTIWGKQKKQKETLFCLFFWRIIFFLE